MANEISIPVRLEILRDSISQMQSVLNQLKPDTTGYKNLQKIIQSMTQDAEKFEALIANPFTKGSQFNKADKSIEKMEETLSRAKIALNNIKFSDLKLDDSQVQQFQAIEQALDAVEKKYASVRDQAKQQLFSSAQNKQAIMGLDPNLIDKDFDTIQRKVDQGVENLNRKLYQAQNRLTEFMNASSKKQEAATKLTTEGITPGSIGPELFNKLFQKTAAGNLRFSSNYGAAGAAKEEFIKYLTEQFSLSKEDVQEIMDRVNSKKGGGTASNFNEVLMNMGKSMNNILTKRTDSRASAGINELKQDVDNYQSALERLQAVQEQMRTMNSDNGMIGNAAKEYEQAVQQLDTATQKLQQDLLNTAKSNKDFGNGLNSAKGQLANFRQTLSQTSTEFLKMEARTRTFNSMKMAITNFMGFYQVLNLVKRGVREALNTVKELDTVMNKISIVTDMSTSDLWGQIDAYSQMAQKYGVSLKGAYEVSQIYYQQGLDASEVISLTDETLKLAKISGLDYAQTTDYMTTALRGFKMEMSEASTVVDVYANLAAHTAVSTEELAVAMSKTASSMESVGSSFQETSAMISTMVAVTRESATNIGSALKSIASRYGELKKDPLGLKDEEGEVLDYNKVDTALKSVGISLKDNQGQFRNMTDVILELSEVWDQLESTQQRYIATQFAGNRQQSRFLALVGNKDLLKANLEYANNADDTGTTQALKALDSIEVKTEQVRTTYQQMYTTIGLQDAWKSALDGAKSFMDTLNHLPKLFGKIPLGAIAMVADIVTVIKSVGMHALSGITTLWEKILPPETAENTGKTIGISLGQSIAEALKAQIPALKSIGQEGANAVAEGVKNAQQDKNQAAAAPTTPTQKQEVSAPAQEAAAEAAAAMQSQVQAGVAASQNANQMAEGYERAASAAQQMADATSNTATNLSNVNSTTEATRTILTAEDLTARLQSTGLHEQIQNQLSGFSLDGSETIQQIQNMFVQIFGVVRDAGGQLKDAFSSAGDGAISGYVNSLLQASGVAGAGAMVGKISVQALRNAIGAHSDADATIAAAEDYNGGYVHTIEQKISDAASAGRAYGQASVEGLKEELTKGFQQEVAAINMSEAIKAKSINEKYGYGLDGLTATDRQIYSQEQQKLDTRMNAAQEALKNARLTSSEIDQKNAILSQIDTLTSQRLTHEQILGLGEGKIPVGMRETQFSPAFLQAYTNVQTAQANLDAAYARAKQPYDEAQAYRQALGEESRKTWLRLNEIGSKGGSKEIREERKQLIARRDALPREIEQASAKESAAKTAYLNESNEIYHSEKGLALQQARERLVGVGQNFGREYNDTINDSVEALKKQLDPILQKEEAMKGAKSEIAQIQKDQAQLDASKQTVIEANNNQRERELSENLRTHTEQRQIAQEAFIKGNSLLSTIPTIEGNIAKQQAEEAKRISEETEKAYEERDKAQAAEDKARVDAINNPLWDKYQAGQQASEIAQMRSELQQMDEADKQLSKEATITPSVNTDAAKSSIEQFTQEATDTKIKSVVEVDTSQAKTAATEIGQEFEAKNPKITPEITTGPTSDSAAQGTAVGEEFNNAVDSTIESHQSTINKPEGGTEAGMAAGQEEGSGLQAGLDSSNPQAPDIQNGKEKGQIAGNDAGSGYEQGLQNSQPQLPPIEGVEAAAEEAAQKASTTLQNSFVPPTLTNTTLNIYDDKGQAYTSTESMDALLSKLQQVGIIAEEQKAKLLELFNTKPPADFVQAYNQMTGFGQVQYGGTVLQPTPFQAPKDAVGASVYNNPMLAHTNLQSSITVPSVITPQVDISAAYAQLQQLVDKLVEIGAISESEGQKLKASFESATPEELAAKIEQLKGSLQGAGEAAQTMSSKLAGMNFGTLGSAIRMLASIVGLSDKTKGSIMALGGAITLLGVLITAIDAKSKQVAATNPWMGIAMGVMGLVNGISLLVETDAEKLEKLQKAAEEASNKMKQEKSNLTSLKSGLDKVDELKQKRYESAEAAEEYSSAVEDLTSKFPELIAGLDSAGNAILDVTNSEAVLTAARKEASEAAFEAAEAELAASKQQREMKVQEAKKALSSVNADLTVVNDDTTSSREQFGIDTMAKAKDLLQALAYSSNGNGMYSENLIKFYETYRDLDQNMIEPQEFINALKDSLATYQKLVEEKVESDEFIGTKEWNDLQNFLNIDYETAFKESDLHTEEFSGANWVEEIQTKLQQLAALDPTSDAASNLVNELTLLLNEKEQYADIVEENEDEFESIEAGLTKYKKVSSELRKMNGTDKGQARILISKWQDLEQNGRQVWSYLEESESATALVTNAIYEKFNRMNEDNIKEGGSGFALTKTNIAIAESRIDAQRLMEAFWTNLNSANKELFNKMFADTTHYSSEDFQQQFGTIAGFDAIYPFIVDYYTTGIDSIQKRLIDNFNTQREKINTDNIDKSKQRRFDIKFKKASSQAESLQEEGLLNNIFENYSNLVNSGYASDAYKYSEEMFRIWDQLKLSDIPLDIRNTLFDLIDKYGLTTKTGIKQILGEMETNDDLDNDIIRMALEQLYNVVHENISLSAQQIVNDFVDSWSTESKNISKLSSGIEISEAANIIQSQAGKASNITIDSFITSGDKLILKEDLLQTYLQNWFDVQKGEFDKYASDIQTVIDNFNEENYNGELNPNAIKELESIMGSNFIQNYMTDDNGVIQNYIVHQEAFARDFAKARTVAEDTIANGTHYFEWAESQLTNSLQWEKGNFESLNSIYKGFEGEEWQEFKNLEDTALTTKITQHLLDLARGVEQMTTEEEAQPDIANAVEQIQSATSTYVSDLLTKDISKLKAKDYINTGLGEEEISAAIEKAQTMLADKFAVWVSGLGKQAGQSLEEQNDTFVKAFEKVNKLKTLEGISDVTFRNGEEFSATTSQLKTFADTYNLSLNNLVENGIATYNEALGQWVVNFKQLAALDEGIDLTQIQGFKDAVQESFDNAIKTMTSAIKSGLGGTLDLKNKKSLQDLVTQYSFQDKSGNPLQLQFNRTKDGYKLAVNSAKQLYTELKKVDAIAAQLVLDELNASLDDAVYKADELDETLSDIAKQRATTESDQFKFMEGAIPSGQNNPLNYWENWGKAFEALNGAATAEGAAKGHMKYQDFYNLVTEMGRLAELTGKSVTLAGYTVDNAEKAASLIEDAGGALENVDGSMQVNLGKVGMNFEGGVSDFGQNVDEGINELAHSQIAMLDSMISLLETITAMEALGDVAGEDMQISMGEIGVTEIDENGIEQFIEYTDKYDKARNTILNRFANEKDGSHGVLDKIKVGTHTMTEILSAKADQLRNLGLSAEQFTTLLNNFWQLYNSDAFDVNKPWESLMALMADMDWGDLTITANAGEHAIIIDETGEWSVDYSSEAAKTKMRGALEEWSTKTDEELSLMAQAVIDKKSAGKEALTLKENYLLKILTNEIKVEQDEEGKTVYKVGNTPCHSMEEAVIKSNIKKAGITEEQYEYDAGTKTATGKIGLKDQEIIFETDENGNIVYKYGDYEGTDKNAALAAAFEDLDNKNKAYEDGKETAAFKQWKVEQKVEVVPTFSMTKDLSSITKKEQQDALTMINNEQWDTLTQEFGVILDPKFAAGQASAADIEALKAAFGIESKTVDLTANVTASGAEGLVTAIEAGTATIEVTANVTATGDTLPEITTGDEGSGTTLNMSGQAVNATGLDTVSTTEAVAITFEGDSATLALDGKTVTPTGYSNPMELPEGLSLNYAGDSLSVDLSGKEVSADIDHLDVNVNSDSTGVQLASGSDTIALDEEVEATADSSTLTITLAEGHQAVLSNAQDSYNVYMDMATLKATGVDKVEIDEVPDFTGTAATVNLSNAALTPTDYTIAPIAVEAVETNSTSASINLSGVTLNVQGMGTIVAAVLPTITTTDADAYISLAGVSVSSLGAPVVNTVLPILTTTATTAWINLSGVSAFAPAVSKIELVTLQTLSTSDTNVLVDLAGVVLTGTNASSVALPFVSIDATGKSALVNLTGVTLTGINIPSISPGASRLTLNVDQQNLKTSGTFTVSADQIPTLTYTGRDLPILDLAGLEIDITNLGTETVAQQIVDSIQGYLSSHPIRPSLLVGYSTTNTGEQTPTTPTLANPFEPVINSLKEITADPITALSDALNKITTDKIDAIQSAQDSITHDKVEAIQSAQAAISHEQVNQIAFAQSAIGTDKISAVRDIINNISPANAAEAKRIIESIQTNISAKDASSTLHVSVSVKKASAAGNLGALAKGNVALAGGTKTLMGELGPELVVSRGQYFLAGQSGAEFVDLDKDAIVFNHKQTERLLAQGGIGSRGIPFTNETNAISQAKGNVVGLAKAKGDDDDGKFTYSIGSDQYHWDSGGKKKSFENIAKYKIGPGVAQVKGSLGPAMASASAALAALKQLRAMWESLLRASVNDLANKAGAGGGGGGGGGDKEDAIKSFLKDLEKWYNWLQQIAQLEKEINAEETKRAKIESDMVAHGQDYFKSQLYTLADLKDVVEVNKSLAKSQEEYLKDTVKKLNSRGNGNNPLARTYQFSKETGQMYYTDKKISGDKLTGIKNEKGNKVLENPKDMTGLELFTELSRRDQKTNKAIYTAEEQYNILFNAGFGDYMLYDTSSQQIFTKDKKKETDKDKDKDKTEGNEQQTEISNTQETKSKDKRKVGFTSEAYAAAVQALMDKMEAEQTETQSLHDTVLEYKDAAIKGQEEINKILQDIEKNQIDVEQKVLKAEEDRRKREIDEAKKSRDAIEKASKNLIDGLSQQLQKERDMYQQQQDADELSKLQRQLAILQRSGGSASQIADLQTQISENMQNSYFDAQQREIDALQEASDTQLEKLDNQIEIMTESLEYEKEHGMLWGKVYEVLAKDEESILDFIQGNTEEYWSKSNTELTNVLREEEFKIQNYKALIESIDGGFKELVEKYTNTTVSQDEKDQRRNAATGEKIPFQYSVSWEGKNAEGKIIKGTAIGKTEAAAKKKAEQAFKDENGISGFKMENPTPQYAKGGMVDETTLALVHAKESVLTPEQTSVLRNEILSNKPTSLLSLLTDFREAYNSISNATSGISNNSSNFVIEQAVVEMNVSQIANDYDARRAGEQALDKIMEIAKKTSAQNRIGG